VSELKTVYEPVPLAFQFYLELGIAGQGGIDSQLDHALIIRSWF
jgi:hypothetical protein